MSVRNQLVLQRDAWVKPGNWNLQCMAMPWGLESSRWSEFGCCKYFCLFLSPGVVRCFCRLLFVGGVAGF